MARTLHAVLNQHRPDSGIPPNESASTAFGIIDAVRKSAMSRRAAARRYEISESVAIKWLERVEKWPRTFLDRA